MKTIYVVSEPINVYRWDLSYLLHLCAIYLIINLVNLKPLRIYLIRYRTTAVGRPCRGSISLAPEMWLSLYDTIINQTFLFNRTLFGYILDIKCYQDLWGRSYIVAQWRHGSKLGTPRRTAYTVALCWRRFILLSSLY